MRVLSILCMDSYLRRYLIIYIVGVIVCFTIIDASIAIVQNYPLTTYLIEQWTDLSRIVVLPIVTVIFFYALQSHEKSNNEAVEHQ